MISHKFHPSISMSFNTNNFTFQHITAYYSFQLHTYVLLTRISFCFKIFRLPCRSFPSPTRISCEGSFFFIRFDRWMEKVVHSVPAVQRGAAKSKTMSRSATYAIITFSFRLRSFTFETEVFHFLRRLCCCCSCPIPMINGLWTLVCQSSSVSHPTTTAFDQKKVDVDGKFVWLGFQKRSMYRVKWKDCTRNAGDFGRREVKIEQ